MRAISKQRPKPRRGALCTGARLLTQIPKSNPQKTAPRARAEFPRQTPNPKDNRRDRCLLMMMAGINNSSLSRLQFATGVLIRWYIPNRNINFHNVYCPTVITRRDPLKLPKILPPLGLVLSGLPILHFCDPTCKLCQDHWFLSTIFVFHRGPGKYNMDQYLPHHAIYKSK